MIAYWERDSEWMGEGLVGAWCPSFTGATGLQLADISGYGNHGTLTNMDPGTDWVASGSGLALDFDNTDDYVDLGSKIPLTDAGFSISGWFNYKSQTGWHTCAAKASSTARQFWVGLNSGFGPPLGGFSFFTNNGGNGSIGTTNTIVFNRWYFFTATHFGNSSTANNLYVASPETGWLSMTRYAGTGNGGVDADNGTNSIFIAKMYPTVSTFPMNGQSDDIRIWNRILTPSEIQFLYTGGRGVGMLREPPRRRSFQGVTIPRPSSNPVRRKPRKNNTLLNGLVGAWCPSLGANGTRLLDVSGRNNHGVLTNMDANTDYIPSGGKLALDCDGTDDICVMRLSKSLELTAQPVSYSFWHTGTVSGAGATLAGLSSQTSTSSWLIVSRSGTNNLSIFNRSDAGGDASVAGGSWSTSNWRHLVAVRDRAGYLSLWQNGVRIANLNTIGGGVTTVNCFAIAGLFRGTLGATSFTGTQWDDARVYERALTGQEINQLYQGGRGYGLKQQRIKVGYTDPSPNLNKISIRKPKKKNTLTTGLVGAWCPSLGPTGTRLRDVSGRNNDGVLTNMDPNTDWITSGGKGALDFDGVNDAITLPIVNPLSSLQVPMTITAWCLKSSGANGSLFTQYSKITSHRLIKLAGYGTGEFSYYCSKSDGTYTRVAYSVVPTLGRLNFLTWTIDGSISSPIVRLGWDGREESFTPPALSSTPDTSVGIAIAANYAGQQSTSGPGVLGEYNAIRLDDIRIYNRALTPQEINQLYVGGRGYGLTPAKRTTSKKTIYVDAPVPAKPKPAVDTSKLKQGLVGAWIPSLGPTGLRLEDKSPYKNHGTLTNMDPNTDWVTSGGLGALDFDGTVSKSNEVLVATNSNKFALPTLGNKVTVCAWVFNRTYPSYSSVKRQILFIHGNRDTNNGAYYLGQGPTQKITFNFFQVSDYAATGTTTLPTNMWIFVCGTWDGQTAKVYYNGSQEGESAVSITPTASVANARIGRLGFSGFEYSVDGRIDDLRIYNRALTAQEVRALYLGGRGYGFRPQRERYILGTETINTGGFKGAWYRRRPLMLGSGIQ